MPSGGGTPMPPEVIARADAGASAGPTGAGFSALEQELAIWKDTGGLPRFWWRDDDLVGASPPLRRAMSLSRDLGVSGLFSAIPADADRDLLSVLEEAPE